MSVMNLNLLPSRAKFQAIKIKYQNHNRKAMMVLIGIWILAVVTVMILNLVADIGLKRVETKLRRSQDSYLQLSENIIISQKLKYKAKMVGGVLDKRFEYGKSFETVQNMFLPTISLKDYKLKENGTFEISGSTIGRVNVDFLEGLVSSIRSGNNDQLKSAKMTSLALTGVNWNFTMEVQLK